jgi:hypothetical protein
MFEHMPLVSGHALSAEDAESDDWNQYDASRDPR